MRTPRRPGHDRAQRVWRPNALWIAVSIVMLALSVVGGVVIAGTVERVNQDRLDVAMDDLEAGIADQVSGLRLIAVILPIAMGEEGIGIGFETIQGYLLGTDGLAGDISGLAGIFPLDAMAGMAFVTVADDATLDPLMLPNSKGLTTADVTRPEVDAAVRAAIESRRFTLAGPFDAIDSKLYVYAVPITEHLIGVEFIAPEPLIAGNVTRLGETVLDVVAIDLEADATVVDLQLLEHAGPPARVVDMEFLGRPWRLEVDPGTAFEWQDGRIAGISAGGLGAMLAIMVFILGVVSRRRLLEEQERLRLARRINEDKDLFIAAVSHELRTPLTAVVGLAEEIASAPGDIDMDQMVELTAIVAHESNEMALLVEDLLVAARAQQGTMVVRPEPVDVFEHLVRVRSALGDMRHAVTIEPTAATVWADPLRMRQIIRNLITNAMRHGGPTVVVRAIAGEKATTIEVVDDGPGVHGEARDRMFEPYYRSATVTGQAPSVGLGLSVAHDLAVAMDGDLTYAYENGMSIFRLVLPAVLVEAPSPADVPTAGE